MPVTIPVGGGTFTAVEGETYILSANTTGNIIFNGDVSFNVVIDTDQAGGVDNQFVMVFGTGTDPTVTYAAGVDASSHQINADGDSLTVDIGDGATVGNINADSVTDQTGPGFVLNAGNNVSVIGEVNGPNTINVESTYTIGDNFSTTTNLIGSNAGDTTMNIGDGLNVGGQLQAIGQGSADLTVGQDATIGNSINLTGNTSNVTAVFGHNLDVTGNIDIRNPAPELSLTVGNNTSVSGDINFESGDLNNTAYFNSGTDLFIGGNFASSNGDDNVIFGDNWFVNGSVFAGQGDDQYRLGYQSGSDPTVIYGEGGTDGMTVSAPLGQEAAFTSAATAAGWTDNGDGTVSAAPGATNFTYNNQTYTTWETAGNPICFTTGTQITVANGKTVNVEALVLGNKVMTADHGLQAVKWIGSKTFGAEMLAAHANFRPIRIAAGALGGGLPVRDLIVSPQHRILVRSKIAQRMFSEDEILVAAKHLVALDGIDVAEDVPEVTYVHFLCDTHEIVFANGAALESLYTGPQALKSLSPEAVSEIMAIFPELACINYRPPSARQIVNGRLGCNLVMRHMKNRRPVMAERHEIAQPKL